MKTVKDFWGGGGPPQSDPPQWTFCDFSHRRCPCCRGEIIVPFPCVCAMCHFICFAIRRSGYRTEGRMHVPMVFIQVVEIDSQFELAFSYLIQWRESAEGIL